MVCKKCGGRPTRRYSDGYYCYKHRADREDLRWISDFGLIPADCEEPRYNKFNLVKECWNCIWRFDLHSGEKYEDYFEEKGQMLLFGE
jgi:hypothetical protein